MEDEISLVEIAATLWKGKYTIIITTAVLSLVTALVSIFTITPLYQATAYVDPAPLGVKAETIIASYGVDDILYMTLETLIDNPDHALEAVSVIDEGGLIAVTVEKPDPNLAVTVADAVATAIAQNSSITAQARVEEQIEVISHSLAFYEKQIDQMFGEMLDEHLPEALLADPVYITLRHEQAAHTVSLYNTVLRSQQLAETIEQLDYNYVITYARQTAEPINLRWQLNTAVAAVLGLMLSVLYLFISPVLKTIKTELQKA
jgi:capsular polysaccharide biosynthesis protein